MDPSRCTTGGLGGTPLGAPIEGVDPLGRVAYSRFLPGSGNRDTLPVSVSNGEPDRICPQCSSRTSARVCPKDGRPTLHVTAFDAHDPNLHRTIQGRYELVECVGAGGFGTVYRAQHVKTGGDIAVKLLSRHLLSDEAAIRRFYMEAQNTHKLHHPNTVRVFDFGRAHDANLFLCMEFVEGRVLNDVLQHEGRMTPARAAHVIRQVLMSLAEAHEHGIVHRDVKPRNIMLCDVVGDRDFVKVLDFGISRTLGGKGASTRGAIGTPTYIAPEQCQDAKVDARADLYSVGVILYELLAGQPPFVAKGSNPVLELAQAHMTVPPRPVLEVVPDACSKELADLVMALLSKNAEDRPQSAHDALAILKEAVGAETPVAEVSVPVRVAGAGPGSKVKRPANFASPPSVETSRSGVEFGWQPDPRIWYMAAGVLVLAIVLGLTLLLSGAPRGRPGPSEPVAATPEEDGPGIAQPGSQTAGDTGHETMTGTVLLSSRPANARVVGKDGLVLGRTPVRLSRSKLAGDTQVRIESDGYHSARVSVQVSQTGRRRTQEIVLKPLPRIQIQSRPPGARVFLEAGRGARDHIGRTPIEWIVPEAVVHALRRGERFTLTVERDQRAARHQLKPSDLKSPDRILELTLPPKR